MPIARSLVKALARGLSYPLIGRVGGPVQGGKLLIVGDSIAAQHAQALVVPSSITLDGSTTAVIAATTHSLWSGAEIYGFRTTREELNGRFTVTFIDANSYSVQLPTAQSGAVAARAGSFNGNHIGVLLDGGSLNWATALNDACWDIVGVHAESGCTTDYLDTLLANSATLDYDWVAIICGINDAVALTAAATIAGNITTQADAQLALGKKVIISTIGPYSSTNAAAVSAIAVAANTILRAYAVTNAGSVFIMDTMAAGTSDGTTPIDANVIPDGIHPSAYGAHLYASQLISDYNFIPTAELRAYLPVSAQQDEDVVPANRQLWNNPMLTGTTGQKQGDVAPTGSVATSQIAYLTNASASLVCSKVTEPEGYGEIQRFAWTPYTSGTNRVQLYPSDSTADALDGETVRVAFKVRIGATGGGPTVNLTRLYTYTTIDFGATTSTLTILGQLFGAGTTAARFPQLDTTLTILTPKRVIPSVSGMTELRPQCIVQAAAAAGTVTIDISRVAMWAE